MLLEEEEEVLLFLEGVFGKGFDPLEEPELDEEFFLLGRGFDPLEEPESDCDPFFFGIDGSFLLLLLPEEDEEEEFFFDGLFGNGLGLLEEERLDEELFEPETHFVGFREGDFFLPRNGIRVPLLFLRGFLTNL